MVEEPQDAKLPFHVIGEAAEHRFGATQDIDAKLFATIDPFANQ